jgi:hypothetical protein
MVDNLTKLYNTLLLIETRGESTKIMAQCLAFMEQMIAEKQSEAEPNDEDEEGE